MAPRLHTGLVPLALAAVVGAGGPAHAARPTVVVESRVGDGPWRAVPAISPLRGETVRLRVVPVAGATIRWYRIHPDLTRFYKNANHPWEPDPYRWVGWARVPHVREELTRFRGAWTTDPIDDRGRVVRGEGSGTADPHPADAPLARQDVGTFWFQVEVERGGRIERSPGMEDRDERGLSPRTFRMAIRDGPGYLGHVTAFFNVPGIFGAVPEQTNRHAGVDCAGVLAAALGRWKGADEVRDLDVATLVREHTHAAELILAGGQPDREVSFGHEVGPGDLLAVRYAGRSRFQHVGALHSDANGNGLLDGDDLVLHAGPEALHLSSLHEGAFDGEVVVLRVAGERRESGSAPR